jgi:hypothetical protein
MISRSSLRAGYSKRSQTELWTSDDGIHFEHQGVSIAARSIGTRNTTYTRVYEYPLKRYVLIDPVPGSPIDNRYRECEFYHDADTLYMYSSGGEKPRMIVYATASAVPQPSGKAETQDGIIKQTGGHQPPTHE